MAFGSWGELTARFRALGGTFDNVEIRTEDGQRGVFAIDPSRECRVCVPPSLLVPTGAVQVVNGDLRVAPDAGVDASGAAFFEDYHRFTSWSDGGRDSVEQSFRELQQLPPACRELLAHTFGMEAWLEPVTDEIVLRQFVRARHIAYQGTSVLAPMLELANHDPAARGMNPKGLGLAIEGMFAHEVTWRYRLADAFQMLRSYMFASPERYAFSLPFDAFNKTAGRAIHVGVDNNTRQHRPAPVPIPVVKRAPNATEITFIVLGDHADPRNGYRCFKSEVAPALGVRDLEFFEGLVFYNRQKFAQLLASVEADNSPAAPLIRRVSRLQLEGLSAVSFQ
jgi:hypothetical protein